MEVQAFDGEGETSLHGNGKENKTVAVNVVFFSLLMGNEGIWVWCYLFFHRSRRKCHQLEIKGEGRKVEEV